MKLANSLSVFVLLEVASQVSALPAFAESVDNSAPIPLNHFKRSSSIDSPTADIGGHNIPIEHLIDIVKESLKDGIPKERPVKPRAVFDAKRQLIDG